MNAARFTVLRSGMHTTIQDRGRNGFQQYGVPVGGVLDRQSASIANLLVGNPQDAPLVEMTIIGPSIEFHNQVRIAIAGADLSATLNQQRIKNWSAFDAHSGDVLRYGKRIDGCRAYLAIAGHLRVKPWLGSVAASGSNAAKHTPGALLKTGHQVEVTLRSATEAVSLGIDMSVFDSHFFGNFVTIDLAPGPELDRFSEMELARLFTREFTISDHSNRMGYRLSESILGPESTIAGDRWRMVSSGVFPGVVQVPQGGTPIILMRDAQTSGGYPRIGVLNDQAIDRIAQLVPGDKIRFRST